MGHAKPGRLGKRNYRATVPFRASSSFLSRLIGMKRWDLVGAVSNCAYAVRFLTAPVPTQLAPLVSERTMQSGSISQYIGILGTGLDKSGFGGSP